MKICILLFSLGLLFLSACNENGPGQVTSTVEAPSPRDTVLHASLALFLDSLLTPTPVEVAVVPSCVRWIAPKRSADSAFHLHATHKNGYIAVRYEKVLPAAPPEQDCYQFIQVGFKLFQADTLLCWQDFAVDTSFRFGGAQFLGLKAEPFEGCNGSQCRVNTYVIIAMEGADTSMHVFVNADDITGIRFGDMNHDGALDFLTTRNSPDQRKLEELAKTDSTYRHFVYDNMECYDFQLISYRKGQWAPLNDKAGAPFQLGVRLVNALELTSPFQVLYSNW